MPRRLAFFLFFFPVFCLWIVKEADRLSGVLYDAGVVDHGYFSVAEGDIVDNVSIARIHVR